MWPPRPQLTLPQAQPGPPELTARSGGQGLSTHLTSQSASDTANLAIPCVLSCLPSSFRPLVPTLMSTPRTISRGQ